MEVEAFFTFDGNLQRERRREHQTEPPTYWFISQTFEGRVLFIAIKFDGKIAYLKTAFEMD